MPFASPGRLSTTTMPIAPAAFTRAAFSANVQTPRETSAIAPVSEPAGSGDGAAVEVAGRAAEVARDGSAVDAHARCRRPRAAGPTSAQPAGVGSPAARANGTRVSAPGASGAVTLSAGAEDVRVRERGDRDRVGRGSGRARRAEPVVVPVVPGRDHRDDAGGGDVPHRLDERVARRVGLRAAAREVDHVHPVADGRLEGGDDLGRVADVADRSRDVEDPVVADLRPRRDAGEAGRLGVVAAARRGRARVAGRDPRDVRAVERGPPVEREAAALVRARARRTRARRSPSASSTSRRPSGSPPGS